ncbi:hypothetical protein CEXT_690321 [Caerostris extrusa]|uniref:Uncharacterized protein n=1 Tax=Caerostris extrusa TaxID=172846 RepID=A0AAV4W3H9_CAEEX|nr:hypothetical protein CEXT_690321 [Caerostris extrusa]
MKVSFLGEFRPKLAGFQRRAKEEEHISDRIFHNQDVLFRGLGVSVKTQQTFIGKYSDHFGIQCHAAAEHVHNRRLQKSVQSGVGSTDGFDFVFSF